MAIECGTFIRFNQAPTPPERKTLIWHIVANDGGDILGSIKWYGPWRKYCFFPFGNGVFEWVCLREIAGFCERKTREHKKGVKP